MDEELDAGVDRRRALKRIAAGGAVVWAVPAVTQLGQASAAGSPPPTACVDWVCGDPQPLCGRPLPDTICLADCTVEGDYFCWQNRECSGLATCTSTADCPAGWGCVTNCCNGGSPTCFPPCGVATAAPLVEGGVSGAG